MITYPELFDPQIRKEANSFASLCFDRRRWYGSGLLIILDACFDSIGLNYFTVVVPKVNYFYENYFKAKGIDSAGKFLKAMEKDRSFLMILKNSRAWNAAKGIAEFVISNKNGDEKDIDTLYRWAKHADPFNIEKDPIGKIKGIGINTFQYLRMQVGIDTTMPDKVIRKWLVSNGFIVKDEFDTLKIMEKLSEELGVSQIELCWAIWIKESNEKGKIAVV